MHVIEHNDGTPTRSLIEVYRDALKDAGRLDTPQGAQVMTLAHLLERLERSGTTTGAASLSKELRDTMAIALKGSSQSNDTVDQLMARRRARILGS
jgi:hypothetical protein